MSIAQIERFAADLKSNEALRGEAEKAKDEASMVAFAASKGYAFTADEAKERAKARKLADGELDGVVGGAGELEVEKAAPKSYFDRFLLRP